MPATGVEVWDADSSRRVARVFLERPAAGLVFGAGHPVAALVCRGRSAHQHALFPASTHGAVAAGPLGAGVHGDQPLPDLADLPRAPARRALGRRAETLRPRLPVSPSARVRLADAGGRVEKRLGRRADPDRGWG